MIEYLSREDQDRLTLLLTTDIPPLMEDLAAAIAKPYEAINYQPRVSTGDRPQPLPYDPSAEQAADYLHAELERWVLWLCQQRTVRYDHARTTLWMARWLVVNMKTLASTPGGQPAYADIASEVNT